MALLSSMSIPGYGMSNSGSNGTTGPEIKIPGTGLTLYGGGNETTPTGRKNAFSESGLTPDEIISAAKIFKLPTTSNRDFQEAIIKELSSTPEGQKHLSEMEKEFGQTKAGTFADNFLGVRTKNLLKGLSRINYEKNRPLLHSVIRGSHPEGMENAMDWAFDFGKDKEAYEAYRNAVAGDKMTFAGAQAQIDSASKGLSPKNSRLLNKIQAMKKMEEDTEAYKDYFNKYGEFPYPVFTSPKGTTDKKQQLNDFLKFRKGVNYKID